MILAVTFQVKEKNDVKALQALTGYWARPKTFSRL